MQPSLPPAADAFLMEQARQLSVVHAENAVLKQQLQEASALALQKDADSEALRGQLTEAKVRHGRTYPC